MDVDFHEQVWIFYIRLGFPGEKTQKTKDIFLGSLLESHVLCNIQLNKILVTCNNGLLVFWLSPFILTPFNLLIKHSAKMIYHRGIQIICTRTCTFPVVYMRYLSLTVDIFISLTSSSS